MYEASKAELSVGRSWWMQLSRIFRNKPMFVLLLFAISILTNRSNTNFYQSRDLTLEESGSLHDDSAGNVTNFEKYEPSEVKKATNAKQSFATIPHQILNEYKKWHSNDVLMSETSNHLNDRSFAMAYYSCPLQAGNRMHHFLNSIIWAIVTNRTILFKYYDSETCVYHQQAQAQIWHDPEICNAVHGEKDCKKVLRRAEWVPTFSYWSKTITELKKKNLSDAVTIVDYWSTRSYDQAARWERIRFPALNTTVPIQYKLDEMREKVVDFPEIVGKEDILGRNSQRKAVLMTESARQRAESLYSEGTEFLYGMLFKDIFKLQWEGINADSMGMKRDGSISSVYSIAMHSRHRKGQDGTFVKKEKECLDRMLNPVAASKECRICIMSDRPKTIEILSQWVTEKYNCTFFTNDYSNSNEQTGSWLSEHGPNAGSRFYRDLDLCQHFTDGFIGTGNGASSTQLLEEWIDYNRKMNHYSELSESRRLQLSSPVDKCWT
jgi:hypothetical protein